MSIDISSISGGLSPTNVSSLLETYPALASVLDNNDPESLVNPVDTSGIPDTLADGESSTVSPGEDGTDMEISQINKSSTSGSGTGSGSPSVGSGSGSASA